MSISRRALLSATAGGGAALAIGFSLRSLLNGAADEPPSADFTPNLWIRIEPAGPIVITIQTSGSSSIVDTWEPLRRALARSGRPLGRP